MKTAIALAASILSVCLFALPASADTTQTAQITMAIDEFVTAHAGEFVDDKLTPEQVVQVKLIAYQAAVAATCSNFILDEGKFLSAFSGLVHVQEADMSNAEKVYFEQHLLVTYGVLVGGALATAAPDPAGFCADAEEARADPDIADIVVWQ